MNDAEKILLYWSGEADDALAREVEELLERDPAARQQLDELSELQISLECEYAGPPREGLLDEVLAEAPPRRRLPFIPLAAAAAVVLGGLGILMSLNRDAGSSSPEVVDTPPPPTQNTTATPLSKRLLTKTPTFRRSGSGLEDSLESRSRWSRLRSRKDT
ncbi:MAG: hypothetical protein AAGB14_07990 [Verrucomicrobiota bacterium]